MCLDKLFKNFNETLTNDVVNFEQLAPGYVTSITTNVKQLHVDHHRGMCLMQDGATSHIAHTTLRLLQAHALAIRIA